MYKYFLAFLFILTFGFSAPVSAQTPDSLQKQVDTILAEDGLVGLAVSLYQINETGEVVSQKAVAGRRKANDATPIGLNDKWHIGSCTKAMTALLFADLVAQGQLSWDMSLAEAFKEELEYIDPAWESVSVKDLFTHRAGIKDLGPFWLLSRLSDERPLPQQRLSTADLILKNAPKNTPGEFNYSNFGYIIAGSLIEFKTGHKWEEAMQTGLPGQIMGEAGWGFGPPLGAQPEGHRKGLFRRSFKPVGQDWDGGDNPKALGPAGTVHATHDVWAKFGLAFISEDSPLSEDMKSTLLTPPKGADYAMGWGVMDTEEHGRIYSHAGSNTMWLSQITLIPEKRAVILVSTNTPPKYAETAIRKARREVMRFLK